MTDFGATFDAVARDYASYGAGPVGRRLLGAVVRRIVEARPASILDVGCGNGDYALALASAGIDVTALDVAPAMLEETRRRASAAGLAVNTVEHDIGAGAPSGTFDAALSIAGPLNYAEDPVPMVENITKALRPGARVWFGLSRGAFFPYAARRPRRLVRPLLSRGGYRVGASVKGSSFDLYLWDPHVFARRIRRWVTIDRIEALVLSPWLPARVDDAAGRLPLLSRLGATSLLSGYVVSDAGG